MSPQSTALQTTDMEAKDYELLYNAVAHQSYPEGITKILRYSAIVRCQNAWTTWSSVMAVKNGSTWVVLD